MGQRSVGKPKRIARTKRSDETAPLRRRLAQAERRMRALEERYAVATAVSREGVYEWDLGKERFLLTDRAKEIFALAEGDLTPAAWNARIHPDDFSGYRAAIVEHFKERVPRLEHEYRIVDPQGGYRWILDRGVGVRNSAGRVTKVIGALSDITERKLAEIEIRRSHDQAQEALAQQTAMSEVLRVMSGSPADAQPVFDLLAQRAGRLCKAEVAVVARLDGKVIALAAIDGLVPEAVRIIRGLFPMGLGVDAVSSRVVRGAAVVHIEDVLADPSYAFKDLARAARYRAALGVPIVRERRVIGSLFVGRATPGLFSESQVDLLKAFADQAAIAIENVRLFTELQARNRSLSEALEQKTATSEILRVISQSPTDVQPVFDTIAAAAMELCHASSGTVVTFDGELIHARAVAAISPEGVRAVRSLFPRRPGPDITATRAILTSEVVMIPDVAEDPDFAFKSDAIAGGFRSTVSVPLMRDASPIGAITVGRPEPGPFRDEEVALLQTFADQAVIAIENARLFRELEQRNHELSEALEQQTATSDILRVISRSPNDVQPVFETIASAALELCRARLANVFRFDGTLVHLAVVRNKSDDPEYLAAINAAFPRPPGRDTGAGRAILTRGVVAIPDVTEDPEYEISAQTLLGGFRSVLGVPLMRDGTAIGAIAVCLAEPGPFSDSQVSLLKTFADQAVIAIENVRLFAELESRNRELTEALEHQTATSEILRVISSSPTDVQPVFDIIGERAEKLCDAEISLVSRLEGDKIHLVAIHGVSQQGTDAIKRYFPMRLDAQLTTARAIRARAVVHTPDVLADPEYEAKDAAVAGSYRSCLAVPMFREGQVVGAIFVARANPGRFPDSKIELLKTFADQAVIAIENVRLFNELKTRTAQLVRSVDELKALGEVGQAVSSTLDLETVLSTVVSRAAQLAGMDGGSIWEYDETREEFSLHATDRFAQPLVNALRATPIRKGEGALGRLALTAEPVEIQDIADERIYQSRVRAALIRAGYRSVLAVPLLREGRLLGAIAVNRKTAGGFEPQVIELLKTFAAQSALAIQNARLFREIEDKRRELEVASQHKSEFLANMSHELRTPLNAIIGFSEVLAERMFGEVNDKQAEYLGDILESGRHLLSLINDILDLSKIEAGRMELEPSDFNLPGAIDNTLTLVRERAQRREVALARTVDERLGTIKADERKVKQVLLNLLSNALKFTPEGGKVDVSASLNDGAVQISVADTGVGIAPEDQEAVFEEFRQVGTASKKIEGTGLGLAISRKFIELHGGRIWVTSEVGKGSTFTFTLPLAGRPPKAEERGRRATPH